MTSSSTTNGTSSLEMAARSLISRTLASHHSLYGISSMSLSGYDTAWVAMITKDTNGSKEWLFPESFQYLLRTQSNDGSWGLHPPTTQTVGVTDTAASLLALMKHREEPLQITSVSTDELKSRISRAAESLRSQLNDWNDVQEVNHIGVEMIIPSLLAHLQEKDPKLTFDFPCKSALQAMTKAKLSRFKPESLYGPKPSTVVHSLEAFIGKIDFDRVSHHLFRGAMMASPSSTAAYLMHASRWDGEAEAWLRHVIKAGSGYGNGGVSGTFPTTHFEITWPLATLLQAGFSKADLDCKELHGLADIIERAFEEEGGIIGWAPCTPDVDDTAKGLLALELLGRHVSPDRMIKVYEAGNHFTTFGAERDPSLTSQCHVLLALLHQPEMSRYHPQILKTVKFICDFWWTADHNVKDKWHLSHLYPTMLLVESFVVLLGHLDNGAFPEIAGQEQQWRICISLFQACFRTMLEQDEDGSWGGQPEQTCYAILALAQARKVCLFDSIRAQIQSAIDRGVHFLGSRGLHQADYNWTAKTAYRLVFVAEAYEIAALKASHPTNSAGSVGRSIDLPLSTSTLDGFLTLTEQTPLFSPMARWKLHASLIESSLFVPMLRSRRLDLFARHEFPISKERYLDLIPFSWVGCNNRGGYLSSTAWLYEMMLVSMFSFQVDEFMESVAARSLRDISKLHDNIDEVIDSISHLNGVTSSDGTNGANGTHGVDTVNGYTDKANGPGGSPDSRNLTYSLSRFVRYILQHDSVLASSTWDRENLRRELRAYLHSNATHIEENAQFQILDPQDGNVYTSTERTFFNWVRTTGTDDVAVVFPFAFACCLISSSLGAGAEVFPTVSEKYLATAAVRHLATVSRMVNDIGSSSRDNAERNINSIHFPEFESGLSDGKNGAVRLAAKKQALTKLFKHEGAFLNLALGLLEEEVQQMGKAEVSRLQKRKMAYVNLYRDVSDLWGQFYIIKDLSSALK